MSKEVGSQLVEATNPPDEASKARRQETVILVHGTFAAPKKDGEPQWYEPGSDFIKTLDEELAKLGSTATCWAHARDAKRGSAKVFSWSGENHWLDRDEAARKLAALLDDLLRGGWRCHVVAHSHGGNVALEALRRMRASRDPGYADSWEGSIVTMGTPFLTTPILANPFFPEEDLGEAEKGWTFFFRWHGVHLLYGSTIVALLAFGLWLAGIEGRSLGAIRVSWWAGALTVFFAWNAGIAIFLWRAIGARLIGAWSPSNCKRLLALTSDHDEAWQLLHGLLDTAPSTEKRAKPSREKRFATSTKRLIRLLTDTDARAFPGRSYSMDVVGWALVAILLVAATRFPAAITEQLPLIALGSVGLLVFGFVGVPLRTRAFIAAPYRIVRAVCVAALYGVSTLIAAVVRRLTMPIARGKAAGSDYLPRTKPRVSREPGHVDSQFYELRVLNDDVMQDTIAARNVATGSALGELIAVLGRHGVASAELDALLEGIGGNISLCHAAYYMKSPYVAMIAAWLARSEEELWSMDQVSS